jgi:26S proteasome regulatory subunit N3
MHEIAGSLQEIRPELLLLLKRASLNRDVQSEGCLINLLLRNYISSHLYDVADKFVSKITFPQQADASEIAKYLYYTGKINAFKLNYSAACQNLFLAIRKCPASAVGFLQASYKLAVLVQLLMGEIPERGIFRLEGLQQALFPYYRITQSVRNGDIALFQAVLQEHMEAWKRDCTLSLVLRLRHNVIRAGVKKISVAYSRISLQDVQKKLLLDTVQDAEYIVMKCIKDGIVDAFINHQAGYVQSRESQNAYATGEPGVIFNKRINFCLDSRAESIRAMRFHGSVAGADKKAGAGGEEDSEKPESLEDYMEADELGF